MTRVSIQPHLSNSLDPSIDGIGHVAGIIGDKPSRFAKSPSLWNAVFKALRLDAIYLPFDVEDSRLAGLVDVLRQAKGVLGFSVTVPYKVKIIDHLDDLDEKARQIGAVNTVVRTQQGRLVGYNTDGSGFIQSLTTPLLPNEKPLLPDPQGVDALIIGTGGAARAATFYLAQAIGKGRLIIAGRRRATAVALADEVNQVYGNASGAGEHEIPRIASAVGLVVNCSTKGQFGLRSLGEGRVTMLEPYSALGSATPATFQETEASDYPAFCNRWFAASLDDIKRNNDMSADTAIKMPTSVMAYDLVYAPLETVFLRHCRLTGHRTVNGKGMNIAQAADAFFYKVCASYLQNRDLHNSEIYREIVREMCNVW